MIYTTLILLSTTCGQNSQEFEVRLGDGPAKNSVIQELDADGRVTFSATEIIPGGSWYSLRSVGIRTPEFVRSAHVDLANGDRIAGTIVEADGDVVRLKLGIPGAEQIVRFPLSAIRSLWAIRRPDSDPAWLVNPRKRDVILTRSADQIQAALSRIEQDKNLVAYQLDGKDLRLDFSKLAAIGFNSDLTRIRKPKGPYFRLTLADGSRMSVLSLTYGGKLWIAQTTFKDRIQIPASHVIAVDVEQGKTIWLADVTPAKFESPSDGARPVSINRSMTGDYLRLKDSIGEMVSDRGIGLQGECRVTYALGGKYRRFEALAGMDARSGIRGDAVLGILVDGKEIELPRKGRLTLAGGPIDIRVDIANAKEMTIVLDRGNGGVVQDHVNLVDARLIP